MKNLTLMLCITLTIAFTACKKDSVDPEKPVVVQPKPVDPKPGTPDPVIPTNPVVTCDNTTSVSVRVKRLEALVEKVTGLKLVDKAGNKAKDTWGRSGADDKLFDCAEITAIEAEIFTQYAAYSTGKSWYSAISADYLGKFRGITITYAAGTQTPIKVVFDRNVATNTGYLPYKQDYTVTWEINQ